MYEDVMRKESAAYGFKEIRTTLVLARLPRALPICARQGAASLLLEKTSL